MTTYLYPWDVNGDPAAVDRIAALGVDEVTLAAAYHAVRAVTPLHPEHRVVTRDAAVYHRPDPATWRGLPLRPAVAEPVDADDNTGGTPGAFERAARRLRGAGMRVAAWLVLAHNDRLAADHPGYAVRNAYGDRYPWALCIAAPEVGEYAATLAAEVAALDGVDAVELEACGWYGFDHAGAHDKTGGSPPDVPDWLLDVCFCPACRAAFGEAGADADQLAGAIRAALDAAYRRPDTATPGELLPAGHTELITAVRAAVAHRFTARVVAAVRAAAPAPRCSCTPIRISGGPAPTPAATRPCCSARGEPTESSSPARGRRRVARTR